MSILQLIFEVINVMEMFAVVCSFAPNKYFMIIKHFFEWKKIVMIIISSHEQVHYFFLSNFAEEKKFITIKSV